MKGQKILFSSQTCEWATPLGLFNELDNEFGFTLDVCATEANALCPGYLDGEGWSGLALDRWIQKAAESAEAGAIVVGLLPARTDTIWFHEWVLPKAAEIRFIRGRLKFGGAQHNAPFPSMIVVWRPQ